MGSDTTNAVDDPDNTSAPLSLPFPPLTTSHILACSYHSWHPHFRSHSPKARLVRLSQPFLDYLRADGILLPPDNQLNDDDSGFNDSHSNSNSDSDSDSATDDDGQDADPSEAWPEIHSAIRSTISSLGGSVLPKLNWSAPKDATWMSPTNDMTCRTANDIYLLLKSSDFITHDLEHAFDDCVDVTTTATAAAGTDNSIIPYHLVLRKKFEINPALEFRCFVRNRHLIALSQRDMNHFDFLFDLAPRFKSLITTFLHDIILPKFHEPSFVLDVYISPQTQSRQRERVWLVDLNPWAQRTDPLLFSWLELLTMRGPDTGGPPAQVEAVESESESDGGEEEEVIRIPLKPVSDANTDPHPDGGETDTTAPLSSPPPLIFDPELRLVRRDDPEAYAFASAKYSAHKLPKDVVDASMTASAMIGMMEEWQRVMHRRPEEEEEAENSEWVD